MMIPRLKTAALFCSLTLLAHSATAQAQTAPQAAPYSGAPSAFAPAASGGTQPVQNPSPSGGATALPQNAAPPPATVPSQGVAAPPQYVAPAQYAAPYPGAPVFVGPPDAGRNAYVQSLMLQRQHWQDRRVGLAVPITLFAVGMGAIVVGETMISVFDGCDHVDSYGSCRGTTPGVVTGVLVAVGGGVLATVGTGMFIGRLIRRGRRNRELRRIDSELQSLGVTASLAPWMSRSASSASAGLMARIRF